MNLILSDVEETISIVDVNEETGVPLGVRTATRNMEMLFVRGDAVIMVSAGFRSHFGSIGGHMLFQKHSS